MLIVALLTEGVDRNNDFSKIGFVDMQVALLTEGVDRNAATITIDKVLESRPPHGGRG